MRTYDPPVKDYAFLLRHVIDAEKVLEEVTGGTVGLEDAIDVIEGAGAVVAPIAALNAVGDEIGAKLVDGEVVTPPGFKEAFTSYAEGGWIGLSLPESIGGAGMPRMLGAAADEFLHGANTAFAMACGLGSFASWVFADVDDPELRSTYAARLLSGQWSGTMDLTEPQAGTDLAAIRTIARPQADGTWKVSGQKIFISWGDHDLTENVVHLVLARTPDAPPGVGGLSLFVVPKFLPLADGSLGDRNAVHCVSLEHKLGLRASPTCVMDYDGATGFLVGEQHRGLRAMFIMMNAARMATGIQGLAVADLAFQKARAYATERVQGRVIGHESGTPIAEHPDVRRLLLSMASRVTAMRALAVQTAAWLDLSHPLGQMFLPVLKGWLTETGVEIASDAIQVHGGAGYIEETGVAQQLRDARILPIFEGTTAVQANHLVSRLLARDSGATALGTLDLIDETREELVALAHPIATRLARRLESSVALVRAATLHLLRGGDGGDYARDRHAVAVPYLHMWGLLAGGWMHGRIVHAALESADESCDRRLLEADFYGVHHLSRLLGLADIIQSGEIVLAAEEAPEASAARA